MEKVKAPKVFRHMQVCKACSLHKKRKNVVVGRGNYRHAYIMIVGEGPGEDEDKSGMPFVGRAGEKLEELLNESGIDKDIIYITNAVKCRPMSGGRNRPPTNLEIRKCSPHLELQISVLQPKIIVVLGNVALQYFCPDLKILSSRGKLLTSKKTRAKIFPIIHPAASFRHEDWEELIRQDLSELKRLVSSGELDKRDVVFGPRQIG